MPPVVVVDIVSYSCMPAGSGSQVVDDIIIFRISQSGGDMQETRKVNQQKNCLFNQLFVVFNWICNSGGLSINQIPFYGILICKQCITCLHQQCITHNQPPASQEKTWFVGTGSSFFSYCSAINKLSLVSCNLTFSQFILHKDNHTVLPWDPAYIHQVLLCLLRLALGMFGPNQLCTDSWFAIFDHG